MLTGAIATIIVARPLSRIMGLDRVFCMIGERASEEAGLAAPRSWRGSNALGQLVPLGFAVSDFTPAAYQRHRL